MSAARCSVGVGLVSFGYGDLDDTHRAYYDNQPPDDDTAHTGTIRTLAAIREARRAAAAERHQPDTDTTPSRRHRLAHVRTPYKDD